MSDSENTTNPPLPAPDASTAPPAPVPPAPVPARPTGTWQTVVGITLIVLSVFSLPRGVAGVIVTLTQPNMVSPAEPLGVAAFGALLVAGGVALLVRASRIRRANRTAAAQQGYPGSPAA